MLSFYFLLSFFPLLLILLDLLGLMSQSCPALQQSVQKYLARLAPSEGPFKAVRKQPHRAVEPPFFGESFIGGKVL